MLEEDRTRGSITFGTFIKYFKLNGGMNKCNK